MKIRALAGAAIGLALAAGVAQAADTFAFTIEDASQGLNRSGGVVPAYRSNTSAALGAPDSGGAGTFYSMGFGGTLTMGFGGDFGTSVTVWETTYGNIANHPESADLYVGYGATAATATFWLVGDIQNLADGTPISLAGVNGISGRSTYNFVRLVDTCFSPLLPPDADGFDVDAVGVGPVPAPGSVALLAAAGLIGARRRRTRI